MKAFPSALQINWKLWFSAGIRNFSKNVLVKGLIFWSFVFIFIGSV